jgi:hypothetical protein
MRPVVIRRWPRWARETVLLAHPSVREFGVHRVLDAADAIGEPAETLECVSSEGALDEAARAQAESRLRWCLARVADADAVLLCEGLDADGACRGDERLLLSRLVGMPPAEVVAASDASDADEELVDVPIAAGADAAAESAAVEAEEAEEGDDDEVEAEEAEVEVEAEEAEVEADEAAEAEASAEAEVAVAKEDEAAGAEEEGDEADAGEAAGAAEGADGPAVDGENEAEGAAALEWLGGGGSRAPSVAGPSPASSPGGGTPEWLTMPPTPRATPPTPRATPPTTRVLHGDAVVHELVGALPPALLRHLAAQRATVLTTAGGRVSVSRVGAQVRVGGYAVDLDAPDGASYRAISRPPGAGLGPTRREVGSLVYHHRRRKELFERR